MPMTRDRNKEWSEGFTLENRDNILVGYDLGVPYLMRFNAVAIPGHKDAKPFKIVVEPDSPVAMVLIYQGENVVEYYLKSAVGILESSDFDIDRFESFDQAPPSELYS